MVSLISTSSSFLVKSLGLLCSKSFARCTCVLPAIRCFSTSSERPPKRPLTGYIRYIRQQRPVFIKQYPDVKNVDITRKIAQEWKALSSEEKRPFQEAAVADREQYKEEMMKFKAQLTPAQTAALEEERREKIARRRTIRKKRELTMLGKPKRPRSAFNIFMAEHFEEAKGVSMQGKMKSLFDDWRNLHASQKQVYMQLAEDDKIRYRNEIKSWEEHMVEIGREDLIRRKKTKPKTTAEAKGVTKSNVHIVKSKGTDKSADTKVAPGSEIKKSPRRVKTEE
ncbi:transcription factor A, mitochondrial [Lepisosteus oculatus]|uniref:transcription factor A, mitochondrial n=1 Tax=Lepisosteus oculatus TaxID=7918 RepID=UPI00073FAF28|nr:PREDICTED: transcription factor A, mitochondrial [Lepisosteus oculatus]